MGKLRKQGLAGSVNELNTLIRQSDTVSSEVARITNQQSELRELRTARAKLLSELSIVPEEIASRRKAQCSTINQDIPTRFLTISSHYTYDGAGITEEFSELVLSVIHGTYPPEEIAHALCAQISPAELAELVRKGDLKELSKIGKLDGKWASEVAARFGPIENLHRLETVAKPPLPIIKVLTKGTPQRQIPVKQLSDGQKHTIHVEIE